MTGKLADKVAIVTGGTANLGKLFAQALAEDGARLVLHYNSPRRGKPFAAMNCAALNENLLDDEMFGHVDGAFTGSKGARKGRFEHADAAARGPVGHERRRYHLRVAGGI